MAHAWKACWVNALGGSNPPSSATLTSETSKARPASCRGTGPLVSVVVSIGTGTGPFIGPQQTADLVGHLPADRVRDVLISGRHRRARPSHDAHHGPLWDTEDQEHGGRRVPRVMQPAVPNAGLLQQRLQPVVFRVRIQRFADGRREDPLVVGPARGLVVPRRPISTYSRRIWQNPPPGDRLGDLPAHQLVPPSRAGTSGTSTAEIRLRRRRPPAEPRVKERHERGEETTCRTPAGTKVTAGGERHRRIRRHTPAWYRSTCAT